MIGAIFNSAIYNPLYNGLIFLIDILPTVDVGVAIIVFTIFVKLVLFPLAQKAVKTQIAMKRIDPELKSIREKHKDDKQTQATKTMELYQENKINPFSSIIVILIQLPIIFGLYFIFLRGGLPNVDTSILYSFVGVPEQIRMTLFGIFDISGRSFVLAILAGATQFFQIRLTMPKSETKIGESLRGDIAHSMQLQMRYVMPVIIAVIAYTLSAAIALYWTVSNLFTLGQEIYLRNKHK